MNDIKNIVISGICRSGKSTLANRIFQRIKCSVIHCDALCERLKETYPETFDSEHRLDGTIQADKREIVVIRLIQTMGQTTGERFDHLRVYDTTVLTPETVASHLMTPDNFVLYLGYPNANPREKLDIVRSDPGCWLHGSTEDRALELITHFVSYSACLQEACARYNIPFVDMSYDFEEAISRAYNLVTGALVNRVEDIAAGAPNPHP